MRFCGVVRCDGQFLLQQDVASIETGVDAHRRHAGHGLTLCDRPLNRRRAAVFRQKRSMKIDIAKRRKIKHPLRNDAAVADHDDGIWFKGMRAAREILRCS